MSTPNSSKDERVPEQPVAPSTPTPQAPPRPNGPPSATGTDELKASIARYLKGVSQKDIKAMYDAHKKIFDEQMRYEASQTSKKPWPHVHPDLE